MCCVRVDSVKGVCKTSERGETPSYFQGHRSHAQAFRKLRGTQSTQLLFFIGAPKNSSPTFAYTNAIYPPHFMLTTRGLVKMHRRRRARRRPIQFRSSHFIIAITNLHVHPPSFVPNFGGLVISNRALPSSSKTTIDHAVYLYRSSLTPPVCAYKLGGL